MEQQQQLHKRKNTVWAEIEPLCVLQMIWRNLWMVVLTGLLALIVPSLQTELVIAGAVMPLVPGLAMTNAVQDTMRGDMVSGLSHGVMAILTAFLIAGGALLALGIMKLLTGGMF